MIKVHKFGPSFGLPDASPFVMKVETYLRMTGQPYETLTADVRKAPRGQLPCIEVDGKIVPDSTIIVDMLEDARADKLDAHLDAQQRAVALAFKSMLEEHVYFGVLFLRWGTDDGWAVMGPQLKVMLGQMGVPSILCGVVSGTARKQVIERARRQGMGRAPRTEIAKTLMRLTDALSDHMGSRTYFCGDAPTTFDATVYAFVAGLLCPAFDNEVRRHAAEKKNLVLYAARMKEKYWSDPSA